MSRSELGKFALIFAGGTMLSRMLGVVRDIVIARYIPTLSRDAFLIAFRLPNMLRDIVGEGAMNAAFVPVFSKTAEHEGDEAFRKLVASAMGMMLILLALITVVGVLCVPLLVSALESLNQNVGADELPENYMPLVLLLSQWTFPYIFFIGMTVFAMGPLFTRKHYSTPSWSPALLNVAIIATCLLLHDYFPDPAWSLVLGVWLGGIAQFAVQYWALGKYAGVWAPRFDLRHPGLKLVLLLMAPVLLGQAAGEVNKMVDTLFSASLGEGRVTALSYANRLVQLPLSLFATATAAALLPAIAATPREDTGSIRESLVYGMRQSYFLTLPSVLGLMVFGRPIIKLLFENGINFTVDDTQRTSVALAIYAAGLLFFAWVKVLVTGFYGIQDTKTPVIVASVSMVCNILLNVIFLLVTPLDYAGLAIATTLSYALNFFLLYIMLGQRFGVLWNDALFSGLVRMTASGCVAIAIGYAVHNRLGVVLSDSGTMEAVRVTLMVAASGAAYFAFCAYLGVPEVKQATRLLGGRLFKTK